MLERRCIICDKDCTNEFNNNDIDYPPMGGVAFYSCGNYGSTFFDPITSNINLEVYICDECLEARRKKIYLVKTATSRRKKAIPYTDEDTYLQLEKEEI